MRQVLQTFSVRCFLELTLIPRERTRYPSYPQEGFTAFSLPVPHRRRLRTTNMVERLNEEIRRRTRVARLFPNEASCLRLVSAIVMEIAEDWQTADKRYLVMDS